MGLYQDEAVKGSPLSRSAHRVSQCTPGGGRPASWSVSDVREGGQSHLRRPGNHSRGLGQEASYFPPPPRACLPNFRGKIMIVSRTSPTVGVFASVLLLFGATFAAPAPGPGAGRSPRPGQEPGPRPGSASRQGPEQGSGPEPGQRSEPGPGREAESTLPGTDAAPRPDALPVAARRNPLELSGPSGAARLPHYDWDGTRSLAVPAPRDPIIEGNAARPGAKKAPLALFIYDYFEPARRIIEARRAAARARYAPGGFGPGAARLKSFPAGPPDLAGEAVACP